MSLVGHQPFAASVHNQTLTISGNTAGASTWSGTNLVFSGPGLSLTGNTLAFQAPATAGDGFNIIAAGSQTASSATTVAFSNANGVSFGMAANVVTASVTGTNRTNAWSMLGVAVSSVAPVPPVVYSDWLTGAAGYWAWISLPP